MTELRTIVLAAGKGTRMRSQTPKVLHPVCGRPLIHYVLDVARAVRSKKVYVALGHQLAQVRDRLPQDIQVYEQKELLGTADAVRQAEGLLAGYRGDLLILCGDTPLLTAPTVRSLLRAHRRGGAAGTLLTAVVADATGYGRIIRDPAGRAVAIREEGDATRQERAITEINVGVYCFQAERLFAVLRQVRMNAKKKEFYLTDVVALLAAQGESIRTVTTPEAAEGWGVNSRQDLAAAAAVVRARVLNQLMTSGVTIEDPATTYISADARIGADTVIRPFTVIEEDVRIGAGCVIGPFARIRPGSRLGHRVEIGNFAEVSRASLGDGCFMKHFSFLGDARIGRQVNIGAGVVTANFDGQNKNLTRIGDQAFIGSDSILVAPVEIGRQAMTGAGCVVTKGQKIPAHGVVVGVPGRLRPRR